MYVDPFFQRSGIGSALLLKFLQAARQAGAAWAKLWVLEKNPAARRFYEKAGFSPTGAAKREEGYSVFQLEYQKAL